MLELDFAAAARFEGAAASALAGPAPGPGRVVLNDTLAGALRRPGRRPGHLLPVRPPGRRWRWPGSCRPGAGRVRRGTRRLRGRRARCPGPPGRSAAAPAPRPSPWSPTPAASRAGPPPPTRSRPSSRPPSGPWAASGTAVDTPKQELLEQAEAIGGEFGSLFLFIGSFAIIAGVMLLVNVFVMLAEERKRELGMLRAVGMRRGRLVRGFVIEGTVYALVASALGLVAGLGVGRAGRRGHRPHLRRLRHRGRRPRPGLHGHPDQPGQRVRGRLPDRLPDRRPDQHPDQPDQHHRRHPRPAAGGRPPPQAPLGGGLDPGRGRVRGGRGGRHRRQPGRRHLPVPGPGRRRPVPAAGPAAARGGPCTPGRRWPCSAGGWSPTPSGPRCSTTAPPPPSSSSAWC